MVKNIQSLILLMFAAYLAATEQIVFNQLVHLPKATIQPPTDGLAIALDQISSVSQVAIEDYHSQQPTRGLTQLPPISQRDILLRRTSSEVIGIEELCSIAFTQQYINPAIVYGQVSDYCSGYNISVASTPPKPKQFKCLICPVSDTCQACTYYDMLLQYSEKYTALLSCIAGRSLTTGYNNQLVQDMWNVESAIQKFDDLVEFTYRTINNISPTYFFTSHCEELMQFYEGCKASTYGGLLCASPPQKFACCQCYCSLGQCRKNGCYRICDKAACCQNKPFPWLKLPVYKSTSNFCNIASSVGRKK